MIFGNPQYFGPQADQNSIFSAPQSAIPPIDLTGQPPQQPAQSFVWGQGGAQLSPEQIKDQQQSLLARQRGDYSPIASPWQGLARVADQALAGFEEKDLDKKVSAANASNQQTVASLLGGTGGAGGVNPAVAAALLSNDPRVKEFGQHVYDRMVPKAQEPTQFERLGGLAGLTPEQIKAGAAQKFNNDIDPLTNIVVGGNSVIGPRSMIQQQYGAQTAPQPPPPEAIARLRANPHETAQFDQIFGQGAAQRVLGGM